MEKTFLLTHAQANEKLNELIAINHDGIHGYETAAESAESERNRIMFQAHAGQRREFANRLIKLVLQQNGEPVSDGHFVGELHQAWLGLRAAVTQGDHAILAECARGDQYAISKYEEMLTLPWPEGILPILKDQLGKLRVAQTKMEELSVLTSTS